MQNNLNKRSAVRSGADVYSVPRSNEEMKDLKMSFGVCDCRQRRNSKTLWHACIRLMRACHICMTLHDHGLLCTSAINLGLHALTLLLSQTDGRTDRQMDVFYFFIKHVLTFFILVMNVLARNPRDAFVRTYRCAIAMMFVRLSGTVGRACTVIIRCTLTWV